MPRPKGYKVQKKQPATAEIPGPIARDTKVHSKASKAVEKQTPKAADQLIQSLAELEQRKKQGTEQLREVERQIYDLETKYLETANPQGNALKGYQGLLSQNLATNKRSSKLDERLFSGSSVTGSAHVASA